MHAQIKYVIDHLKFKHGKIYVDLSAGQHTPLGRIIGKIYNTNVLHCLEKDVECFGCPYTGGQHKLELVCRPLDAIEMVELIKEEALAKFTLTPDECQVAHELSYISQEIHVLRKQM